NITNLFKRLTDKKIDWQKDADFIGVIYIFLSQLMIQIGMIKIMYTILQLILAKIGFKDLIRIIKN
ncbi:hypothetical protein, partial [Enterobacter cancerogenus]|uniref:hypothetical protein n=1 Tax=Enterobacter cancerogenus TaxID=69218 RepID=UPI0019D37B8D